MLKHTPPSCRSTTSVPAATTGLLVYISSKQLNFLLIICATRYHIIANTISWEKIGLKKKKKNQSGCKSHRVNMSFSTRRAGAARPHAAVVSGLCGSRLLGHNLTFHFETAAGNDDQFFMSQPQRCCCFNFTLFTFHMFLYLPYCYWLQQVELKKKNKKTWRVTF